MDARAMDSLVVEDAAEAVKYRVYPDTPLDELVDLMVRRGVRAVPVVGERYEVLGIVTTGDALERALREAPSSKDTGDRPDGSGGQTARDIMTRAVLCVSESQPLADAARMMVNRKVEQLPVVRDGELVGLLTRKAVLRALFGDPEREHETEDDS